MASVMSVKENTSRANIRIEIKNDFTEEMEVDTSDILSQDIEDGEISDSKSTETQDRTNDITETDIFQDEEKLQFRAERFGLQESTTKSTISITESELQELYSSLGITEDEVINTRFEAIHMYGTSELSTQDVFDYFGKYSPGSIEWINDESCNVVWLNKSDSARALFELSRTVEGMPVDEFQEKEEGRSILLKNREVVLSDDGKEMNKVKVSDIDINIPSGFWRLGEPHSRAKYILLRFAKNSDKKPLKSERFSEYYRKYGNPNLGGIRGLISESKKKKMKGLIPEEPVPSGNPWGNLAKNWNNDVLERDPDSDVPFLPKNVSKSILNRLGGNKRSKSPEVEEPKKSKVPRMRMYADEEEARVEKIKQMKKIKELEKIEEKMAKTVPDLRNRIGRHTIERKLPEPVKLRPVRVQVTKRNEDISSDDEVQVQQKSKVTVIVKKPAQVTKPSVASTIWSRLDLEKKKQQETSKSDSESKSDSSKSDSDSSDSESEEEYNALDRQKFSKAVNSRPGFNRDLKSRLGLNTDHKSPLRIEINNDHYKK